MDVKRSKQNIDSERVVRLQIRKIKDDVVQKKVIIPLDLRIPKLPEPIKKEEPKEDVGKKIYMEAKKIYRNDIQMRKRFRVRAFLRAFQKSAAITLIAIMLLKPVFVVFAQSTADAQNELVAEGTVQGVEIGDGAGIGQAPAAGSVEDTQTVAQDGQNASGEKTDISEEVKIELKNLLDKSLTNEFSDDPKINMPEIIENDAPVIVIDLTDGSGDGVEEINEISDELADAEGADSSVVADDSSNQNEEDENISETVNGTSDAEDVGADDVGTTIGTGGEEETISAESTDENQDTSGDKAIVREATIEEKNNNQADAVTDSDVSNNENTNQVGDDNDISNEHNQNDEQVIDENSPENNIIPTPTPIVEQEVVQNKEAAATDESEAKIKLEAEIRVRVEKEFTTQKENEIKRNLIKEMEAQKAQKAEEEKVAEQAAEVQKINDDPVSDKDCYQMSENDYYCFRPPAGGSAHDDKTVSTDVYSRKDTAGDAEIFLREGPREIQITLNEQDDLFPSRNAIGGNEIVWQSLQDERWQIFIYEPPTKKITQLTGMNFNNMNPHIWGDVIVWQAWEDDNWEIYMAQRSSVAKKEKSFEDGNFKFAGDCATAGSDNCWKIKRVTTNNRHDMFPKTAGNFVTWQSSIGGMWQIYLYDIANNTEAKVGELDGKNENPRFSLLWEKRESGGELNTFAYDFLNSEVIGMGTREKAPPVFPSPEKAPYQEKESVLPATASVKIMSSLDEDGDDDGGE